MRVLTSVYECIRLYTKNVRSSYRPSSQNPQNHSPSYVVECKAILSYAVGKEN
jgi:hypothetical protein